MITAKLTLSEMRVLRQLARGLKVKEAALETRHSPNTVKAHKRHIIWKLGAKNSAHAVALAFVQGILTADDLEESYG